MRGEPIRAQPKPVPREKARKPLQRKARLRTRGKTAHARRPRDFEWMGKVAALKICIVQQLMSWATPCSGRFEVNHMEGRYVKDGDRKVSLFCSGHHADWTGRVGGGGVFAGWTPAQRRGWAEVAVAVTRSAVEARLTPENEGD